MPILDVDRAPEFIGHALAPMGFTQLSDSPAEYGAFIGAHIRVNAAGDGLEFGQRVHSTDSPTFADLTLTEGRYASSASFILSTSTAVLGVREIYACPDSTTGPTLTISSVDIAKASLTAPWIFSVKDEFMGPGPPIMIVPESGLIENSASYSLPASLHSVTVYCNGTDCFVIAEV